MEENKSDKERNDIKSNHRDVQNTSRTLISNMTKPQQSFGSAFDDEETKEELYAWETKEDDNNGFNRQ